MRCGVVSNLRLYKKLAYKNVADSITGETQPFAWVYKSLASSVRQVRQLQLRALGNRIVHGQDELPFRSPYQRKQEAEQT